MGRDYVRLARHALLAFIAICCGLMLVWAFSGKVRAAEPLSCVPLAQALTNLDAAGYAFLGELRLERFPDVLLIVVSKDGYGATLAVIGGCVAPMPVPLGRESGVEPGDMPRRPVIRAPPAAPRADA